MSRPATTRLKVNPQLGRMPTLQFCRPDELRIDPAYQRDIASGPSQTLIRKIAQFWNWDLCQPLVVARRVDLTERLFVIDGQHRLEAARLRGDIDQLPCVVLTYVSVADEAASFVHLNQQRRPLSKLDVFKAAVASEDDVATAIMSAIADAGLSVASHTNHTAWKPGMIANIGGIERAWRCNTPTATKAALGVLSEAFRGQVLRYAGTIFPGIVVVCADEIRKGAAGTGSSPAVVAMLASKRQTDWRRVIYDQHARMPNLSRREAAEQALRDAWAAWQSRAPRSTVTSKVLPPPPPAPKLAPEPAMKEGFGIGASEMPGDKEWAWCKQCDARRSRAAAEGCKSRFCSLKVAA